MLIWDEKIKGHIITIQGETVSQIEPAKLNLAADMANIKTHIETLINTILESKKTVCHCRIKINSIDQLSKRLDYRIWLGKIDQDPKWDLGSLITEKKSV